MLVIIKSRISDHNLQHRAFEVQGPYEFWKVMEIENAIFQHLGSFGKERISFKMALEKFCIFVWKNSNHILKWMTLSFC